MIISLRGFKCKHVQIAAASLAALVDESFLVSYLDRPKFPVLLRLNVIQLQTSSFFG